MTVTRTNSLNLTSFQDLSDKECKPFSPSFQKRVAVLCSRSVIFYHFLSHTFWSSSTVSKTYTNAYHLFFSFMKPFHRCKAILPVFLQLTDLLFPAAASDQLSNTVPLSLLSTSPSCNKREERTPGGSEGARTGNNTEERRKPKLAEDKNRGKRNEGV